MRRVWLVLVLILTSLNLGSSAHGHELQATEKKLGEIVQQFSSPYVRNPMFLCYHMGRLQSFADILAIQIYQLATRATANPGQQALNIAHGQQLHLKTERLLKGRTYDCDPQFPSSNRGALQSDEEVVKQIKIIRKKMRGVAAEDLVIGCFHTGRLSMLTGRLNEILHQQGNGDPKMYTLLNDAAKEVRGRSKRCKAQSIN